MRRSVGAGTPVVVKIGSSSLTGARGRIDAAKVEAVVRQTAELRDRGHAPVLVSSGAIAAGFASLGFSERPTDIADLQVSAAVGQTNLMARYGEAFGQRGIQVGQVLLTKDVLGSRTQYLNARSALGGMLSHRVIPIVNENDTVAVDEVRLGDNDQLAAMTAHLVSAGMLVILTDTDGLYSDDPRVSDTAELLAAVEHSDAILDRLEATTAKGAIGSGGVATKIVAARMAAFSGVPTVIAGSGVADGVRRAVAGEEIGTWIAPRPASLSARKLWIAFGVPTEGFLTVDAGAAGALARQGSSLLAVGVTAVSGTFERGHAIEVVDPTGRILGKGLVRLSSAELTEAIGSHSSVVGGEVIHRDDLVVFDANPR
ncbi:MAG: glutamate 5-kinase [Actinomycetota bacterium]